PPTYALACANVLKPESRSKRYQTPEGVRHPCGRPLCLGPRGPELLCELAGAVRDARTEIVWLEHDRLPTVRDDLADDPFGTSDPLVGDRCSVDERARAFLD